MQQILRISFIKANPMYEELIYSWLAEPHMVEFLDNSQEHKEDISNFIHGRKQTYFAGTTQYWIGSLDDIPYAFILSDILKHGQSDLTDLHIAHMSKTGHNIALDFAIGNKQYLRQGLAAPTLIEFMQFYKDKVDPKVDSFFIDPDENNPRAMTVYEKAGFKRVGEFTATHGAFVGKKDYLMVKNC